MAKGPRISSVIAKFFAYINKSTTHLFTTEPGEASANWVRLTLTAGQATEWSDRRIYFRDTLYPKYIDPALSTSIIKKDVKLFIKNFRLFGNPLLKKMASCGFANTKDEAELNFIINPKNRSKPTTSITEACITALIPKTGAKLKTSSRTSHDDKHSSVANGATGVQYAYKIGGSAPADPEDGTVKEFLSGSSHLLSFGVANVGKKLFIYTRWFNPSYPQFAGPWSDMQTGGVS